MQLATFVISSDALSVEQIALKLGCSADFFLDKGAVREGALARIPARQATWEIREEAPGVGQAVERLLHRLDPLRLPVQELVSGGCVAKLSVVQYANESSDLSFALEREDLLLLAEIGAFVDVVHYFQ